MHLKHLIDAAWRLDSRSVYQLAEKATDAGEITLEEAKHLQQVADLVYYARPTSSMYRRASLALQAWAAKEH